MPVTLERTENSSIEIEPISEKRAWHIADQYMQWYLGNALYVANLQFTSSPKPEWCAEIAFISPKEAKAEVAGQLFLDAVTGEISRWCPAEAFLSDTPLQRDNV